MLLAQKYFRLQGFSQQALMLNVTCHFETATNSVKARYEEVNLTAFFAFFVSGTVHSWSSELAGKIAAC